jgi:hypothetical protein
MTWVQELLSASVSGAVEQEHVIDASSSFFDYDTIYFEHTLDDFYHRYQTAVGSVATHWGPPEFNDGMGNPSFPQEWCEAEFLACWQRRDHVAYVVLRQDDKELPFILSWGLRYGVAPKQVTRSLVKLEQQASALTTTFSGRPVERLTIIARNHVKIQFSDGSFLSFEGSASGIKIVSGP